MNRTMRLSGFGDAASDAAAAALAAQKAAEEKAAWDKMSLAEKAKTYASKNPVIVLIGGIAVGVAIDRYLLNPKKKSGGRGMNGPGNTKPGEKKMTAREEVAHLKKELESSEARHKTKNAKIKALSGGGATKKGKA